jgi:ATP-dependent Clp protease ATP-binding subunit ClpA
LRINASEIVDSERPETLFKRHWTGTPKIQRVDLQLAGPPRSIQWRDSVDLKLHSVIWRHGEAGYVALIPELRIELMVSDRAELDQAIEAEVRSHLMRTKAALSLGRLAWWQRCRTVIVDETSFVAAVRTPKQIVAGIDGREEQRPVIPEVATDLTRGPHTRAFEMDQVVNQMAEALTGRFARSVLLVGPSGVGKTAAVHELVRRRHSLKLGHNRFWATSGSRLIAGMTGFGMWQQRCGRIRREAAETNAILHLGNLVELMEVGKNPTSSQGIAGFLTPYLARGEFLAIAECTPEQLSLVEREDPHLVNAFFQIKVVEPSRDKGLSILSSYVRAWPRGEALISPEAVSAIDLLHRRYATYSAYAGRPIRFLRRLLQEAAGDQFLGPREVTAAFSRETGMPLFLLEDSEPLDLGAARDWFQRRVLGQPEVIDIVLDVLAMTKARMSRPGRPIASLLFIGPTGVGKTETAKSLAEFLFRERDRLVRFDMSEYADQLSVSRLVGGVYGSEGLLTARVREQPFGVILLDEFEKAHPSFFDLLLQVLGEGRLTDAAGRVADFCNSVVIMTSNLGVESFQKKPPGFWNDQDERAKTRDHFTREVRAFVRPELFNRLDRIVPFSPLDEDTVLGIAKRELDLVSARDGVKFGHLSLNYSAGVPPHLARKGYDPRYGARPLKRVIERELLVPLAEELNSIDRESALVAEIHVDNGTLTVGVKRRLAPGGRPAPAADSTLTGLIAQCTDLRRDVQALERCPAVLDLRNEIYRLERTQKRETPRTSKEGERDPAAGRLPLLKRVSDRLAGYSERVTALEDSLLMAMHQADPVDTGRPQTDLASAINEWSDLLLTVYSTRFSMPDYATLAIYGENVEMLFQLAGGYWSAAAGLGATIDVWKFASAQGTAKTLRVLGRTVAKVRVGNVPGFFETAEIGVVGIVLGITGPFSYVRYHVERGLHSFISGEKQHKCLVEISQKSSPHYMPSVELERRGSIARQVKRRTYDIDSAIIDDPALKKRVPFQARTFTRMLAALIEDRLLADAKVLLAAE